MDEKTLRDLRSSLAFSELLRADATTGTKLFGSAELRDAIAGITSEVIGIPSLKDRLKLLRQLSWSVGTEPLGFDQPAAQWRLSLLVLSGEVVFAHHLAQVLADLNGFTLRMKCFSARPLYSACPAPGLDDVISSSSAMAGKQTWSHASCSRKWPTSRPGAGAA